MEAFVVADEISGMRSRGAQPTCGLALVQLVSKLATEGRVDRESQ